MVFHVSTTTSSTFRLTDRPASKVLELPAHLNCNPRALREGYLAALAHFLDEVRRGCAAGNVDYQLLRTSQPLDAALTAYLSNRLGMHSQELTT